MKLIEDANKQALARILEGEPRLIDIVPARDVLERLKERMILHAGAADHLGPNVRSDAWRGSRRHRVRRLGSGS
ncbi:sugar-specific transcriptional regulator TrmB [Bradyrhizobium elkanii]